MKDVLLVGVVGYDDDVFAEHDGPTWLLWGTEGDEGRFPVDNPAEREPAFPPIGLYKDAKAVVFTKSFVELLMCFGDRMGDEARHKFAWLKQRGLL